MGPPKKKPPRKTMLTKLKEANTFEYRWNSTEGHWYLFNPYTGETILGTNYDNINRADSMWAKPDKRPSREAYTIELFKEIFKSRLWGVRPIPRPFTRDRAATVIAACVRGYFARENLRSYYRARYHLKTCPFSGYDYFVDDYTITRDGAAVTSWHKPILARPLDIKERTPFDPDDHMANGDKYSYRRFDIGPYLRQESLGKGNVTRVPQKGFLITSDWRDSAVGKNEDIPLDAPLGTVIAWFDGLKTCPLTISHYVQARRAICHGNWDNTLELYNKQNDQLLTRLYCLHSFSKTEVPMDGETISFAAAEVLNRLIDMLGNPHHPSSLIEKLFMLRALHTLLSVRPGRAEFFSIKDIKEEGDERQKAIDAFYQARVGMFNRFLAYIPTEVHLTSVKGTRDFFKFRSPKPENVQLVECVFQCLGDIAVEPEQKETMSTTVVEYVYYAMKVCQESAMAVMCGMKIFYALMYRCESAQQMILCGDSLRLLRTVRHNHGGDLEVMRVARKLELALKENGWRGNVEKLMAMEMRGETIPRKYLKKALYEREFSDKFKFPLEQQEDERVAQEEADEAKQRLLERQLQEEEAFQKERSAERALSRERSKTASRDKTFDTVSKGHLDDVSNDFKALFSGDDDSLSEMSRNTGSIGVDGIRRKSVHFPDNAETKEPAASESLLDQISALQGKIQDIKGTFGDDQYLESQYPAPLTLQPGDEADAGSVISEMTGIEFTSAGAKDDASDAGSPLPALKKGSDAKSSAAKSRAIRK